MRMTTDYERIKRSCLKRGELWEDPDFAAVQISVFYHQKPPFQFIWKRPKEICMRPVFVNENTSSSGTGPTAFDISPGKMGDKWLVCCLGVLYLSKGLFYRVVPADQTFSQQEYAGIFRFRLWWCGQWVEVLVDDRLPTVNGKLAFLQSSNHIDQFWPALLEKAYAKLHGSYEALKYGTLLDGLADLTGGITESIPMKHNNQNGSSVSDLSACCRMLNKLLDMTSLITCITQQTPSQPVTNNNGSSVSTSSGMISSSDNTSSSSSLTTPKLPNGILAGINYRVYCIERVERFDGQCVHLVRLRNPLSKSDEYVGPWSWGSSEWDDISTAERDRLMESKPTYRGVDFWMPFGEFIHTFTHLEVVHLDNEISKDEPSLQKSLSHRHHGISNSWQMRIFHGCWQKGVQAGGCRNNPQTFHINPQLNLVLSDTDEIIISLNQHSIMEPKVIGFTVYSLEKNVSECVGRMFFKKHKSLANSQYTNSRQVSQRYQFDGGNYLILPTTFEPGQESNFTLRIYSSQPLKLRLLDTPPALLKSAIIKAPSIGYPTTSTISSTNGSDIGVTMAKNFTQYESVFLQLADEHRTVNAFELQELLDACLPNDYIKSCACIEVCRQIVIVFNTPPWGGGTNSCMTTGAAVATGRLKFVHFKDLMCSLKYWQIAFKNHTKEKTGILKAERLKDALLDVGFQLNTEVSSTLILKYMRKDGTLRFGDFVSAILHLTVSFAAFEQKDPLQNGTIKLTLAEWLKSSLTC